MKLTIKTSAFKTSSSQPPRMLCELQGWPSGLTRIGESVGTLHQNIAFVGDVQRFWRFAHHQDRDSLTGDLDDSIE